LGSNLALTGASGAGKSFFVKLIDTLFKNCNYDPNIRTVNQGSESAGFIYLSEVNTSLAQKA
jgi:dephospho-CoA kinase